MKNILNFLIIFLLLFVTSSTEAQINLTVEESISVHTIGDTFILSTNTTETISWFDNYETLDKQTFNASFSLEDQIERNVTRTYSKEGFFVGVRVDFNSLDFITYKRDFYLPSTINTTVSEREVSDYNATKNYSVVADITPVLEMSFIGYENYTMEKRIVPVYHLQQFRNTSRATGYSIDYNDITQTKTIFNYTSNIWEVEHYNGSTFVYSPQIFIQWLDIWYSPSIGTIVKESIVTEVIQQSNMTNTYMMQSMSFPKVQNTGTVIRNVVDYEIQNFYEWIPGMPLA